MMNKRIIAGLMCLSLAFGAVVCPGAADKVLIPSAAQADTIDDGVFVYGLTDDRSGVKVIETATWPYEGRILESADIPSVVRGLPVKEIGAGCFASYTRLEKVTLPDSIEVIGDRAFFDCRSLNTIRMPAKLKKIGQSAFMFMNLKTIVLPDGCKEIGSKAFYENDGLTVTIPDSVTVINENAFQGTKNVTIKAHKGSYAEKFVTVNNKRAEKLEFTYPITFVEINYSTVKGDISGDGKVDITDIAKLSAHIKSKKYVTDIGSADINGDGIINISDLTVIAAHIKGKRAMK